MIETYLLLATGFALDYLTCACFGRREGEP
jgi:hypothetical protein